MENVCLQCGSTGFSETLVLCSGCKACALHRYCLDGPVVFTDDVTWFCEDCEIIRPIEPPPADQPIPLPSGQSDSVSLANNAVETGRELRNCKERVKNSNQPKQKKTKKKKGKVNSSLLAKKKGLLSVSRSAPEVEGPQCSIGHEEESGFKDKRGPVPRYAVNSNLGLKSANDDSSCLDNGCRVDVQPVADPIWRGSLYFCNKNIGAVNGHLAHWKNIGTVSGLLAHWSNIACTKVLEETARLPEVLQVELLPRPTVWPKSFKNGQATDESIALYFFPENERAENVFDSLVDDIIKHTLAIRVVAENAELLIFPSTTLPMQHRRFQDKYYLWGVFRAKQTSHETNDAVCRENGDVVKLLT